MLFMYFRINGKKSGILLLLLLKLPRGCVVCHALILRSIFTLKNISVCMHACILILTFRSLVCSKHQHWIVLKMSFLMPVVHSQDRIWEKQEHNSTVMQNTLPVFLFSNRLASPLLRYLRQVFCLSSPPQKSPLSIQMKTVYPTPQFSALKGSQRAMCAQHFKHQLNFISVIS